MEEERIKDPNEQRIEDLREIGLLIVSVNTLYGPIVSHGTKDRRIRPESERIRSEAEQLRRAALEAWEINVEPLDPERERKKLNQGNVRILEKIFKRMRNKT